jgi:hypothetical protein
MNPFQISYETINSRTNDIDSCSLIWEDIGQYSSKILRRSSGKKSQVIAVEANSNTPPFKVHEVAVVKRSECLLNLFADSL